jgi:hypothetical protein
MAAYNFSALDTNFTSHEFILTLAQQNQVEYISALHHYAFEERTAAPFQAVHKGLVELLKTHPELVTLINRDVPSKDIFGKSQACGEWEKVQ